MEVLPASLRQRHLQRSLCSSCFRLLSRLTSAPLTPQARNKTRAFHRFEPRCDDKTEPTQAHSLSGYYADILSPPVSSQSSQPLSSSSSTPPPEPSPNESRARILFGSRLAGSGYDRQTSDTPDSTWRTINGVPIPPRPAEPDNCCMSGCVHCVWDDYRDEVESWAVRLSEAQATSEGVGIRGSPKAQMPRGEVMAASGSMDDDGGGSEGLWDSPRSENPEDLFQTIPVGIREFMRTEKRLRDRKREEKEKEKS